MALSLTLEQVKEHLRYDFDAPILNTYLAAANSVIERHIDAKHWENPTDDLNQAALLLIGYWDNNRDAEKKQTQNAEDWFLPPNVRYLLTPYRTPTVI